MLYYAVERLSVISIWRQAWRTGYIYINVGGKRFVTSQETISQIPGTRLAELTYTHPAYVNEEKEFYFDRNAVLFDAILDVYRTGEFHFPHCLCGPFVKKELEFWGLSENHISVCCQRAYHKYEEERKHIRRVQEIFTAGDENEASLDSREHKSLRLKLWHFLEDPTSSKAAKVWGVLFTTVVLASVAILCMITDPTFRIPLEKPRRDLTNLTNPKLRMYVTTDVLPALMMADFVCFGIFFLDLVLRFALSPSKCGFVKSVYNIIDFLSIVPVLAAVLMEQFYPDFWRSEVLFRIYFGCCLFEVLRAVRLLKYARHVTGVRVLMLAIRSSLHELFLLLLLMFMGMLIFSALIYFAEFHKEDDFLNIPIGFWWSIVTMTTVGYGDKHPSSGWGYIVGAVCAVCGMLSTGLPIPIIASNFNFYYSFTKAQIKRNKQQPSDSEKTVDTTGEIETIRCENEAKDGVTGKRPFSISMSHGKTPFSVKSDRNGGSTEQFGKFTYLNSGALPSEREDT